MKYIKTVGIYNLYDATQEECKDNCRQFPSIVAVYKGEQACFGNSESDFETLAEAEKWCKENS